MSSLKLPDTRLSACFNSVMNSNRWFSTLVVVGCLVLSACKTSDPDPAPNTAGPLSHEIFLKQMEGIDRAYESGEITKAEQLKLRLDVENAYQQRRAAFGAAIAGGWLAR